jgi:16S rRNA U516 pseudouridylate synthase RsuA-like enzyme
MGFAGGRLDQDIAGLTLSGNTAGFAFRVVGRDTERHRIYLIADKHYYGVKNA